MLYPDGSEMPRARAEVSEMTADDRVREPRQLCGARYEIASEDRVYCGLHVGHVGMHIALFWWFEDGPGDRAPGQVQEVTADEG